MNYSFTKLNEIKPPMVAAATKDARAAAEQFAKDQRHRGGRDQERHPGLFLDRARAMARAAAMAWPTPRSRRCAW